MKEFLDRERDRGQKKGRRSFERNQRKQRSAPSLFSKWREINRLIQKEKGEGKVRRGQKRQS